MSKQQQQKVSTRTNINRSLGQGIKTLHDPDYAEVDIIAIPGLGTNPVESWTYTPRKKSDKGRSQSKNGSASSEPVYGPIPATQAREKFNWIKDPDGLASIFPKSRIMLYDYASAYRGNRKVRATLKSICAWLLEDLTAKRQDGADITRPLIFIAHSMGGVVVAKALCMAKLRREYEPIIASTMGCVFFGTPFTGTNMAKIALLYTSVFGNEAYQSLLLCMRAEKNDTLDELTEEFMEIRDKLQPPIELVCFWEQMPLDASYADRIETKLPTLLQHKFFKASATKALDMGFSAFGAGTHFVDQASAVLHGADAFPLTADHRDLVKFESIASEKFSVVKSKLTNMVQSAKVNGRKRLSNQKQKFLTQKFVNQVRQSLEGVDMRPKFRSKVKQHKVTSWMTQELLYQEWMLVGSEKCRPYLWLRGGPGLGKTNACLAAIQQLYQAQIETQNHDKASQSEPFLAYFLCEYSSGCCTAEEVLKGLITQLLNQDESLAQHARWFVPNPRYRGLSATGNQETESEGTGSGAKASETVDNLYKVLQDMIEDPVVNSIHIVISNLHCLETSESTTAFLTKLSENAVMLHGSSPASGRIKWLLTSRNDRDISRYLVSESISLIDLENDLEYGSKVKVARQKHARDKVMQLKATKNYTTDLAYYVRNSIESQSEEERWIDVVCTLLADVPSASGYFSVKGWLKEVGHYNINKLVDHAWSEILRRNPGTQSEIEELLQALTIAEEPPTVADLAVLTNIDDIQRVTALVRSCAPVLQIAEYGETKNKIIFANPEFKTRLTITAHGESDFSNSQMRRFHGLIALRCFEYIKSSYKFTDAQGFPLDIPASLVDSSTTTIRLVEDAKVLEVTNEDDEDAEDTEITSSQAATAPCYYPIKYLFKHLSEGFPDVAQELCEDDPDFWGRLSSLRMGWLNDYQTLTHRLEDLDVDGMSALHVAAGIGANEVVSILLSRNGEEALSWVSRNGMSALHVAARNNHSGVVDLLLRAGADIEAGDGDVGTALHQAALKGRCGVMSLLIEKGANVNAFALELGPVINAAIRSGTVDAVKQIMDREVEFNLDYTKCPPPLSLAAGLCEASLFQDILESGRSKWLQNVKLLDQALIAASENARLESVRILLEFPHIYTNTTMEDAILSAATQKNWVSVNELLDYAIHDTKLGNRSPFELGHVFYFACTSREERLDILDKIWSFTNHNIPQDIRDFSLYQAAVMRKTDTATWLLNNCDANVNTTSKRPDSVPVEDVNIGSQNFWNPINAAASTGNLDLVKVILDKGADISSDDCYALQLAASEGHTEVVEVLVTQGSEINRQAESSDELGFYSGTALQAACDNNRKGAVEILIRNGADPNLGGGALSNPITAASQRAEPEILKLLLSAPGVNVNVRGGNDQSTPLINAATHMSTDVVELLVEKGADINAMNSAGDTPLIMAALKGDQSCVDLLCTKGADVTYKSPRRGLAILAAAEGSNPLCARVLAERMGGTIDGYREQVKIDQGVSKENMDKALATLEERGKEIEGLSAMLTETKEQLEESQKEIRLFQLEKNEALSDWALQGQTYGSIGERMKTMEAERIELHKQIDSLTGRVNLSSDTNSQLRALLDEERQTSAGLRKRQGWTTLQDEKNQAIQKWEDEKQASADRSEAEKQKRERLRKEIESLQNDLLTMRQEAVSAHQKTAAITEQFESEQLEKEKALKEVEKWQDKCREVEDFLEGVQEAAAARNRDKSPAAPRVAESLGESSRPNGSSVSVGNGSETPPMSITGSLPASPGWMTSNGYARRHGNRLPDGGFGSYRKTSAAKPPKANSLYSDSSKGSEPSGNGIEGGGKRGPVNGSGV